MEPAWIERPAAVRFDQMHAPDRSPTLAPADAGAHPIPPSPGAVEVLLFGRLREAAGRGRLELPLPSPPTASELWRLAVAAAPRLAGDRASLRAAVNERFAGWETELRAGDRVAFLPPLSGG